MEQREREEKDRLARQRSLLRIGVELWLVGVVRSVQDAIGAEDASGGKGGQAVKPAPKRREQDAEAEPFPLEVLKELLGRDRDHINLPLVVLFVKHFAYDVLGVKVRATTRKNVEEDGVTGAAGVEGEQGGESKSVN